LIADTIRVNLKYGNKLVPAGSINWWQYLQ
jgi:hypothetical protein